MYQRRRAVQTEGHAGVRKELVYELNVSQDARRVQLRADDDAGGERQPVDVDAAAGGGRRGVPGCKVSATLKASVTAAHKRAMASFNTDG